MSKAKSCPDTLWSIKYCSIESEDVYSEVDIWNGLDLAFILFFSIPICFLYIFYSVQQIPRWYHCIYIISLYIIYFIIHKYICNIQFNYICKFFCGSREVAIFLGLRDTLFCFAFESYLIHVYCGIMSYGWYSLSPSGNICWNNEFVVFFWNISVYLPWVRHC
jgi:hypothetical protein